MRQEGSKKEVIKEKSFGKILPAMPTDYTDEHRYYISQIIRNRR
jgi:hypothetical protein